MARDKLKKLRKDKGLTQKEVADKIGVSRSMYTSIESGTRDPSLKVMQRIVDFFGDRVKEIFF
jgi:putative transcriptional regulator